MDLEGRFGRKTLVAVLVGGVAAGQSTSRASVDSAGMQATSGGGRPSISADGRFVSIQSDSRDLVPGDTNGAYDIFVHDRRTGATTRASVDSATRERRLEAFRN
jgi:Tol biopolymer transport system component